MLKEMKKNKILTATVMIILGAFMLIWPGIVSRSICYFLGAVLIFFGITKIIAYVKLTEVGFFSKVLLLFSILMILLGVALFIKPDFFSSIIPILVGICVLLESINGFMSYFQEKDIAILIRALLLLAFGILLLWNPFGATQVFIRIIGIYLILDGISQIYISCK